MVKVAPRAWESGECPKKGENSGAQKSPEIADVRDGNPERMFYLGWE
jgi:hypothetical protein